MPLTRIGKNNKNNSFAPIGKTPARKLRHNPAIWVMPFSESLDAPGNQRFSKEQSEMRRRTSALDLIFLRPWPFVDFRAQSIQPADGQYYATQMLKPASAPANFPRYPP